MMHRKLALRFGDTLELDSGGNVVTKALISEQEERRLDAFEKAARRVAKRIGVRLQDLPGLGYERLEMNGNYFLGKNGVPVK